MADSQIEKQTAAPREVQGTPQPALGPPEDGAGGRGHEYYLIASAAGIVFVTCVVAAIPTSLLPTVALALMANAGADDDGRTDAGNETGDDFILLLADLVDNLVLAGARFE